MKQKMASVVYEIKTTDSFQTHNQYGGFSYYERVLVKPQRPCSSTASVQYVFASLQKMKAI